MHDKDTVKRKYYIYLSAIILVLVTNVLVMLYVNANMPNKTIYGFLKFTPEKYSAYTRAVSILIVPLLMVLNKILRDAAQNVNNSLKVEIMVISLLYILTIILLGLFPHRAFEIGYCLAVIAVFLIKKLPSKSVKHFIVCVVSTIALAFISENVWAVLILAYGVIDGLYKEKESKLIKGEASIYIAILVICVLASPILKNIKICIETNTNNTSYYANSYQNQVAKDLIKDSAQAIPKEKYVKYIEKRYNVTQDNSKFPQEIIAGHQLEKEKLIREIDTLNVEQIMPTNYNTQYIILYLFIKNKFLLVALFVSQVLLYTSIAYFYKGLPKEKKVMPDIAIKALIIKSICYLVGNVGYSTGSNMNLLLLTDNKALLALDIFLLAIIIIDIQSKLKESKG